LVLHEKQSNLKILCLVSGGIDSIVMMYRLKKDEHELFPLFIDYGQKAKTMEEKATKKICSDLNLNLQTLDISGLKSFPSGLTNPDISPIDNPDFPARNLLFLTLGAAYAKANRINIIAIGLVAGTLFTDQNKEFVNKAELTISEALGTQTRILSPLIDLNKLEVVRLAKENRIPLEDTYSCYVGNETPCSKCLSCKDRDYVFKLENI